MGIRIFISQNISHNVIDPVFRMQVETTSMDESITIPHLNDFVYNYVINYGDGSGDKTVNTYDNPNCTHVFTNVGTYDISISGICETIFVNNDGTLKLQLKKILSWGNINLKVLNFYGCSNLNELCGNGQGLSKVVNFASTFYDCTSLTTIPTDLFRYNVNVSTNGFTSTFQGCTSLTTIPNNLFDYNVNVSSYGFASTFYGCTSLTTIPTDLFRYNVNVSTYGFASTFRSCTSLTTIPTDLFRYNVNVSSYGFYQTFFGCNKLQLNQWIFYADGEQSTRFLNKSVNFEGCFYKSTFNGTQGTAPDLWNCNFGTGTPVKTGCFGGGGNSATSLSNYVSILAAWK